MDIARLLSAALGNDTCWIYRYIPR